MTVDLSLTYGISSTKVTTRKRHMLHLTDDEVDQILILYAAAKLQTSPEIIDVDWDTTHVGRNGSCTLTALEETNS